MDIFISYRRDDSAGHAGRLYDHLSKRFGTGRVFMDIDAIPPGADFNAEIDRVLRRCAVVLVVIGRRWLESMSQRRQTDYLRAEISAALGRGASVRVIPVLVDGAVLPERFRLPADLQPLVARHAFQLNDRSFAHDANKLIDAIARHVRPKAPGVRRKRPQAAQVERGGSGSSPPKAKRTRSRKEREPVPPEPRAAKQTSGASEAAPRKRAPARRRQAGEVQAGAKPRPPQPSKSKPQQAQKAKAQPADGQRKSP
ncbi:MAG: toll/interleukin-1 receptor domain-containing protein, partial [Longimicrobiaceae bacterium]